jgi:hypothetical protein
MGIRRRCKSRNYVAVSFVRVMPVQNQFLERQENLNIQIFQFRNPTHPMIVCPARRQSWFAFLSFTELLPHPNLSQSSPAINRPFDSLAPMLNSCRPKCSNNNGQCRRHWRMCAMIILIECKYILRSINSHSLVSLIVPKIRSFRF